MEQSLNRYARAVPVWAVWLGGAIPLTLLVFDTLNGRLGIDPVRDIEWRLGRTALYFLIATLAVTPLLRLTRINLIRFRRALGLICFAYAALHVASWVVFDMAFLWGRMVADVVKRPYLIFGMVTLVLLVAMAVTSNNASIRKMGAQSWRRLHKLIYVAAPLAAVHWIWSLKVWEPKPLAILAAILLLLAIRVAVPRPLGRRTPRAVTE